jgi:thiosulfate reductase/polysulfide reductase chain A
VHKRNTTQNNAILHEMMPTNSALLHPKLAAHLKIKEGQTIRVSSRVGAIELPAHLTETLREDCVMVAHGFGHRSRLLSNASGKGVRDGDLVPDNSPEEMLSMGNFGGSSCIMDVVVNIEPL